MCWIPRTAARRLACELADTAGHGLCSPGPGGGAKDGKPLQALHVDAHMGRLRLTGGLGDGPQQHRNGGGADTEHGRRGDPGGVHAGA